MNSSIQAGYQHQNIYKQLQQNFEQKSDEKDIENKKFGKWSPEEDKLLRKYVRLYGRKWRRIAEYIPGRSSIQCLHRWSKTLNSGLVKGLWTPEEDQKLITWVTQEGPQKWAKAAALIKGRSGKQCRERWVNQLNPEVRKGGWTEEEDEKIFELYQQYGSSWSRIAKFIPGRTENRIKNRFYSTFRKVAADRKKTMAEMEAYAVRQELLNESNVDPAQKKFRSERAYHGSKIEPKRNGFGKCGYEEAPQASGLTEHMPIEETNERAQANRPNTLYKLLHHEALSVDGKDQAEPFPENMEPQPTYQIIPHTNQRDYHMTHPEASQLNKINAETCNNTIGKNSKKANFPNMNAKYPQQAYHGPSNPNATQNYRKGYQNKRHFSPQQTNIPANVGQSKDFKADPLENDSEFEGYIMDLEMNPEDDKFYYNPKVRFNVGGVVKWGVPSRNLVSCSENGDVREIYEDLENTCNKIMSYCKDNIKETQNYRNFIDLTLKEIQNMEKETEQKKAPELPLQKVQDAITIDPPKKVSKINGTPKQSTGLTAKANGGSIENYEERREAESKGQKHTKLQNFSPIILSIPPESIPAANLDSITEITHLLTQRSKEVADLSNDPHQHRTIGVNQSFVRRNRKENNEPQNPVVSKLSKPELANVTKADHLSLQPSLPQLDLFSGLSSQEKVFGGMNGIANIGNLYQMVNNMMNDPNVNESPIVNYDSALTTKEYPSRSRRNSRSRTKIRAT